MNDARTADAREEKLPGWTRDILRSLRLELATAEGTLTLTEQENRRLRSAAFCSMMSRGDADTFLVNDDTGAELPLGTGPDIRFGDFYTVRYGTHEDTAGAAVLIVETDRPMIIRPVNFNQQLLIAPG